MPFDSTLRTNISPLIEGQVPDYISEEHQVFVSFIKSYYQFLEAAELILTATIDHVVQETVSVSYILDEDSKKIVTETGSGTLGKFVVNETITGTTSNATAKVLVDDLEVDKARLFITTQQKFIIGETITGSVSGATGTITSYRANPIQNIQQLQDFVDPDNSIDTFLNELVSQFIKILPSTVASETSKRDLIKNIRDLYSSEATKLFLRILFDEESEVTYPNKYMIRASKGDWIAPTVLRVTPTTGSNAAAIIGQKITGQTSGATALVVNSSSFQQGIYSVTEIVIDTDSLLGTFVAGEIIVADSLTEDVTMSFTVYSFITYASVESGGSLYSTGDKIALDSTVGNGFAELQVGEISSGGITDIFIKTEGDNYQIGDSIVFTPHADDVDISPAEAVVSVVGGSILTEDTVGNDDYISLQHSTSHHTAFVNKLLLNDGKMPVETLPYEVVSGSVSVEAMLLDGTDANGRDSGHKLLIEDQDQVVVNDRWSSIDDQIVLEDATVELVDVGSIKRIAIIKPGFGYTKLPTLSITSSTGTSGELFASSSTIGSVLSVNLRDGGFDYTEAPKSSFTAHFILRDVTGTFATGNALTTHNGTISNWDATRNLLSVTIDDAERMTQEFSGTYNPRLELEQYDGDRGRIIGDNLLEDKCIGEDGEERNAVILFEDYTAADGSVYVGEGGSGLKYWGKILIEAGGTDGNGTDAGDTIILDRTNSSGRNAGDYIIQQSLILTFLDDTGGPRILDGHLTEGHHHAIDFLLESDDGYLLTETAGQSILLEEQDPSDEYELLEKQKHMKQTFWLQKQLFQQTYLLI